MRLFKVTTPEGVDFVLVNNEEEVLGFVKPFNPLAVYITEVAFYDLRKQALPMENRQGGFLPGMPRRSRIGIESAPARTNVVRVRNISGRALVKSAADRRKADIGSPSGYRA